MMQDDMAPGADQYAQGDGQGEGGYCIELHVSASGEIRVAVEQEYDSMPDADEGTEQSMPAADIGQALKLAQRIYAANGQLPQAGDMAQADDQDAQDQMMQGYGKGSLRGLPVRKVFERG